MKKNNNGKSFFGSVDFSAWADFSGIGFSFAQSHILVQVESGIYKARTKPKIQKASLGSNYKLVPKLVEPTRCVYELADGRDLRLDSRKRGGGAATP